MLGLLLIPIGVLVGSAEGGGVGISLNIFRKESLMQRSRLLALESTKKFRQAVAETNATVVGTSPHISLTNFTDYSGFF